VRVVRRHRARALRAAGRSARVLLELLPACSAQLALVKRQDKRNPPFPALGRGDFFVSELQTLAVPDGDPASIEVVGRELNRHAIALRNSDIVLAHFARDVAKQCVTIFELNFELRVG